MNRLQTGSTLPLALSSRSTSSLPIPSAGTPELTRFMTRSQPHSTLPEPTPVLLIAPGASATNSKGELEELENLLQGLNYRVIHTLTQRHVTQGTPSVVGPGKLQQLQAKLAEWRDGDGPLPTIAIAADITPSQQRYLERTLETDVLDRSHIILRVFSERARSHIARLEIEVARLHYELPRVRDDEAHADREGGGGRGGRGDSNVELFKQQIRDRIAHLRREIETQQALRRRRGVRRQGEQRAALVGYTNAGKSSWMRALTGSPVLVEDQLFATLDTTVRALSPATTPRILISDTVGFIQDLPHGLVASFRSTLDEALETDLLLHVLDASDPYVREHYAVTRQVLEEVGAQEIPSRLLLNKSDRLSASEREALAREYPEAIFVSAHAPEDVIEIRQLLIDSFSEGMIEEILLIPFQEAKRAHELREHAKILEETYTEEGIRLKALAPLATWERLGYRKPNRPEW